MHYPNEMDSHAGVLEQIQCLQNMIDEVMFQMEAGEG